MDSFAELGEESHERHRHRGVRVFKVSHAVFGAYFATEGVRQASTKGYTRVMYLH